MKILVINWLDRENPLAGGAEEHLHEVFGRMAARGHEVTALVSGWPGCAPTATLDGMEIVRVGRRYTFSLAAPRAWRRSLRARGFDVVVEDLNKVPLFAPLWVDRPVVLLAHHLFGPTAFQAASAPIAAATWLLERPIPVVFRGTRCVAVSESTREDLERRGLKAPIDVIPNGIDVEAYTPEPSSRTVDPTLLFLGRLKQYKRVDLVIDAVARLAEEGIDVRLRVGGAGDHDAALRDHARARGVEERVDFLGYVTDEAKLDLLRSSWIHVLTSSKEGWGISNLEAGACGTPTVASDAPGLRESVVHDRTGLLVPHGDVDALTDALRRLIRHPDLRERLGREARTFAEGYSWEASSTRVEELLERVVAGSVPE